MAFPQPTLHRRPKQAKSALLISPFEQDHKTLRALFRQQGWKLYRTGCLADALTLLRKGVASVVITEGELPTGNWRDVLTAVALVRNSPLVVVSSRHADDRLWAEALNLGAYDVLAKPIEWTEAVRVLNSAWMRSAHQYR